MQTKDDNTYSFNTYLAILLQAFRLFALATHVVPAGDAGLESFRILGSSFFNGLVADIGKAWNVVTLDTVAAIAKSFLREAFAVKL